jgi:peptidoglycan hydrolase-like protein with peptidoglycan-binding domain
MMNAKWRVAGGLAATLLLVSSVTFADADQTTGKTKSSTSKKTTSASASHSSNSAKTKTAKTKTASSSTASRKGKKSRKSAKRGQQKIDSERTQQIQEALIKQHYLTGDATGKWDANTEAALRKFQSDNGWQNKTVPDSRALIKLGLGPSHDHLLNPESAMTGVPDTRSASNVPANSTAHNDSTPQTQPQR